MRQSKRYVLDYKTGVNDLTPNLKEFESKMEGNPNEFPIKKVIIWHVDEINDRDSEEVHGLWQRLMKLKHSGNPQALHFFYFSGVFDLKTFGRMGPKSPSPVSWIYQEPFDKEDLEKLYTSYLSKLDFEALKIPQKLFETEIGNSTKNAKNLLAEIALELFGGIPRLSGIFYCFCQI